MERLADIRDQGFDAIFYPGGHGPLWDLANNRDSKRVTGFSNSEEQAVGLTEVVPFLVEDMLRQNGGHYEKGDDWASFVLTDGKLVTGQNPASSEAAAKALLALF